jgi:hypothetical protein
MKEGTSLFTRFSAARGAALALLAALAAGCSGTGVAPAGSSGVSGTAETSTVRENHMLANGQGLRGQSARTAVGWLSPEAKKKPVIYWGNFDSSTITIYSAAGKTQSSQQIAVTAGSPFALSLSKNEKELYVSVETASFIIQSIAYPKGTTLADKLTTNGGDWPLSISPDSVLGS